MKKKLFTLSILFSICGTLLSQNVLKLTSEKNTYLAGDSLYKYQVEYKDPGSIGRELEWDFNHLQILQDNYLIKYFHPDTIDTTKICGMEHRTRYYYRQRNDSLWSIGFENYTTLMNYTKPELKLKFPFSYGDTLYSTFTGKGIYSNRLPLRVKGYTRIEADAEGSLKLPDRTINNALRVHSVRQYTETGKDSLQMTLDTYSWYVQGVRYPVFESIKTTIQRKLPAASENAASSEMKDSTVFRTSFYYSPEELNNSDSENTDVNGNPLSEAEKVFTEARMNPNPVISDLIIDYRLTRKAQIWFSIHNNIGIPMSNTSPQIIDEGYHQNQISMGGMITGTYTVYVHVDDMVVNRVVVKR